MTCRNMAAEADIVRLWVEAMQSNAEEKQYEGAVAIRNLTTVASNKDVIRECGGVDALLHLVGAGPDSVATVVAAEALSCLVADDHANRDIIRVKGGIDKLVQLLDAGSECEVTHRALLAVRVLTEREVDRMAIHRANGIPKLVGLLKAGPKCEVTEYAAAALGNLAAGGQILKNAIREAGAISPLVGLLEHDDPDDVSAELAAVVLRNLAFQNDTNRQAIRRAGGLSPLLRLLSTGQARLVYPMHCEVTYGRVNGMGEQKYKGLCCFDPICGHLCVVPQREGGIVSCFHISRQRSPRDKSAQRFSLMGKLTITERDAKTLEVNFSTLQKEGAPCIGDGRRRAGPTIIKRVLITPTAATELKGAIMRLLTRLHLEREFKIGKRDPATNYLAGVPRPDSRLSRTSMASQTESRLTKVSSTSMVFPLLITSGNWPSPPRSPWAHEA